jgi:hypothetical protein
MAQIGSGKTSGGAPAGIVTRRRFSRRRHGRRWLSRATEHYLAKEKHQRVYHTNATSPRAKTKPMMNQGRRAAWRGGRWCWGRASSSRWHLGSVADVAKGLDGGGCARHPCLYSPKAIRVRKEEDLEVDSTSANFEKGDPVVAVLSWGRRWLWQPGSRCQRWAWERRRARVSWASWKSLVWFWLIDET